MQLFTRLNCRKVLIILILVSFQRISGQITTDKKDKETIDLINEAPEEKGKESGAFIILRDYQITVNEKGQRTLVIRIIGKVLNKEALSDYSQIIIRFNSYYDEAELNYAKVIYKDGVTREVPRDAVQIKTTPEREGLQYTDSRYLSFALSGMEIGAAFDYKVTFKQKIQEIPGQWYDDHWFGGMQLSLDPSAQPRIDPVLTSRYTLLVPKGSKFQYHLYSAKGDPEKTTTAGTDKYQWVFTDVPRIKVESGMPPLSKLNAVLVVSSLQNWEQIDQWATREILTKVETSGDVFMKAKELTSGKNSNDEKIVAIKDYIQTNIHYIYADLDRGGFTPHSANEILKSRYGDCKDQAVLFISMLKSSGIEAYPALINPFPYDEVTEIPTPQFTHIITFIPQANKELWLDMTSDVTPFPNLFFTDQDRKAFIINGKGGRLTQTPSSDIYDNKASFEMATSYRNEQGVVQMKLKAKGAQSDMLKQIFKELDKESIDKSIKRVIKSISEKAIVDSIVISDLHNPETPFTLQLKYHLDSIWIKDQNGINFGSHSALPLSMLTNANFYSLPDKRDNDIIGVIPYSISGKEIYLLPDKNLVTVSFPRNDSIRNETLDFTQTFDKYKFGFTANWTLSFKDITVKKEQYNSYKNSLKKLNELNKWMAYYVDPDSYLSSVSKASTPAKMIQYANQIQKDDPGNLAALLIKGMAYVRNGQFDQAIALYKDMIKTNPDCKYPYVYIAYPLIKTNNTGTAIEYLNKAIKIDPYYWFAYSTRGGVYEEEDSYEKALADYNTTIKVKPDYYLVYKFKTGVLIKLGRELEAMSCLEELTRLDSTDITYCSLLGQFYLQKNLYKKAIFIFQRAVTIDPTSAENWGNLGWSYYMINDDKKCIEYSSKAVEYNPTAYFAKYNLGLAYLRSGNISEARRVYSEMNNIRSTVKDADYQGALKDLNDLKVTGKYPKEIKGIIKDFFNK
jgi:tetratricopeptide (TPR) repeat protein